MGRARPYFSGNIFRGAMIGYSGLRGLILGLALTGLAVVLTAWLGSDAALGIVAYIAGVFSAQIVQQVPKRMLKFLRPPNRGLIRGDRYVLGGHDLDVEVVDLPPGGYEIPEIDVKVLESPLRVPKDVAESADTLDAILVEHPLRANLVFENSPCLVICSPIRIRRANARSREEPGVSFDVATTSYFVKALSRGCPPQPVVDHVEKYWPSGVLKPQDVRQWLMSQNSEDCLPLRLPNFGLTLGVTLRHGAMREQLTGIYQRRGRRTATHAGVLSAPISEAFNLTDIDPNSPFLNVAAAAQRAAGEELGVPGHEAIVKISGLAIDLRGSNAVDANGVATGGGYNFVGHIELDMSPEELVELRPRDRFENEEIYSYPLTAQGLAARLLAHPARAWFPLGVIAMLSGLEAVDSHGPSRVGAILRRSGWRVQ